MDKVVIPPLSLMAAEDVQRKGGTMYEALIAALAAWPGVEIEEDPDGAGDALFLPLTTQEKDKDNGA